MKRIIALLCALSASGCLWNVSGRLEEPPTVEEEDRERSINWSLVTSRFKVERIVSGDMIEVYYPINGRLQKVMVKLLGVDAPDKTPTMTEYQGYTAYAMVAIALDRQQPRPELLNLVDRDMLQERVSKLISTKKINDIDFRAVRLLDDNWEMRMMVWPYIPLRVAREWNTEKKKWDIKHLYAYVYSDKLALNRFLIEEGFAKLDRQVVFDQKRDFEEAEDRARRRSVGVWSIEK